MAFKTCCLSLVQLLVVIFAVSQSLVECENILFLLPVPSPSHRLWNNVLIEGLVQRGHNLTILSVENERSRTNVTFIYMENVYESLSEFYSKKPWSLTPKFSITAIKEHHQLNNFISRKMFETKGLRQLANYPKSFKFDAVVFDFTLGQSLLAFREHFQWENGNFPPLISVSPFSLPPSLSSASSTQIFPSFISHFSITSNPATLREKMSQRFVNLCVHIFDWFYRSYVFMENENRRLDKVFGGNKLKLERLEQSDLVLINREFAFDDVLALPPNVIPVGALQAERFNEIPNDVRVLETCRSSDFILISSHSQDVFTFVERSDKPIILFTLGSNVLARDLGWQRYSEIMNAFRDLSEFNFICKCDAKFIRNNPQNVLFVDWFQQNELLGKIFH